MGVPMNNLEDLNVRHHYSLGTDEKIHDIKREALPKIELAPHIIRVDCSVISIEAVRFLLQKWEEHFLNKPTKIKLQ